MTYSVKEVFHTLQGEGAHTGTAAVFLRFSGCNLWNGLEEGRASGRGGCARWCDTDFARGTKMSCPQVLEAVASAASNTRRVVCTGGEPLLQLDSALVHELQARGFQVAIETNGTLPLPEGCTLDWVCVSPKDNAPLALTRADELKLVFPQLECTPERFESFDAPLKFLQPRADVPDSTARAISYVQQHPTWRLSLQTHKLLGLR